MSGSIEKSHPLARVPRAPDGRFLPGANCNPGGRPGGWRVELRAALAKDPQSGNFSLNPDQRIWGIMIGIAEGRPIVPILPDGRHGPPIIPTAADCLRAAIEITHALYGRPVDQDRIVAAEAASAAQAAIRNLPDGELLRLAQGALARLQAQGALGALGSADPVSADQDRVNPRNDKSPTNWTESIDSSRPPP